MSAAAALRLRGCRWRWLQQGCGSNRRKTGQRCARLLRRRAAAVWSERPLLVVFNSLLATIKTVGSERLLRAAIGQQQIDLICGLGMTVETRVAAIVGIAWKGGGRRDGSKGSRNAALIPDDRTPEGAHMAEL
ncbi:hypothetical protein BHE74_00022910 [Ensete ventricosum]|nr:hypothetical protein BHE74_00022910 [Ensete ventricosum]